MVNDLTQKNWRQTTVKLSLFLVKINIETYLVVGNVNSFWQSELFLIGLEFEGYFCWAVEAIIHKYANKFGSSNGFILSWEDWLLELTKSVRRSENGMLRGHKLGSGGFGGGELVPDKLLLGSK